MTTVKDERKAITMKQIIIATIITCIIIIGCSTMLPACAEDRGEFYPKLTVVVGCEQIAPDLWIIDCMDKTGNVWNFYEDEEPWEEGDLANLLMWNMGEAEEEDEVIEVYYEGHLDNLEAWIMD